MSWRIILCSVILSALILGAGWMTGILPIELRSHEMRAEDSGEPRPARPEQNVVRQVAAAQARPAQDEVVRRVDAKTPTVNRVDDASGVTREPIVISNARLALIQQQDVPAQREGVLLFIGCPMGAGEQLPPGETAWDVTLPSVPMPKRLRLDQAGKSEATAAPAAPPGVKSVRYRRLRPGDIIAKDQLLAIIDPTLALAELRIKAAKVTAADADQFAAEKTRDEAARRLDTARRLRNGTILAMSLEELNGTEMTYWRYYYESISKLEGIHVAEQERDQAKKTVEMYMIRAQTPGVVKSIYKHDGEAVKSLEPVVQIQNYDLLRVDALVDAQHSRRLHAGDTVTLEPAWRQGPDRTLRRHRGAINGVAVTADKENPLIVSASEDGSAILWDLTKGDEVASLSHDSPVRAVACLGPQEAAPAKEWCLTGTADGRVRLWDLKEPQASAVEFQGPHKAAIASAAFSPSGKRCATGSDDGEIVIWQVPSGEQEMRILAHRQQVATVALPSEDELVSIGRDDTIRLWKLGDKAASPVKEVKRRSSDVSRLGIDAKNRRILDPQSQTVTILSDSGTLLRGFQNSSQAAVFKNFALFSPDGMLALTTSNSEGGIQLWKLGPPRSYELRQLNPTVASPATCAAFAPNDKFIVSGTSDGRLYVWDMPTQEEITKPLTAVIRSVGGDVQSSDGQVPIIAEFHNPAGPRRLLVGDSVTVVAEPK